MLFRSILECLSLVGADVLFFSYHRAYYGDRHGRLAELDGSDRHCCPLRHIKESDIGISV